MSASEERPDRERLVDELQAVTGDSLPAEHAAAIRGMHPAEIADLLESLPADRRHLIWPAVPPAKRGELLVELHGEVRQQLIDAAEPAELVQALRPLQMDELADLENQLPARVIDALVSGMDATERRRFEAVRQYPDDCAGGLMDIDALAVDLQMRLGDVQAYLQDIRQARGALPEHTDRVFAVEENQRYAGQLLLADLVSMPPETRVRWAMGRDLEAIPVEMPAVEVARRFEDRDLVSAPVVNADGQLLGRITIDDVVDVIRGQGEQALLGMAGLNRNVDLFPGTLTAARRRAVWLAIHLLSAFLAAWVIGRFERSIESLVALAVLMPVVAGMGGVAGNQSLALVTRGLALNQVGLANAPRLMGKELSVALLNGLFWSALVALVVFAWFGNLALAGVFALALTCNLLNGAFTGTWLPLVLSRLGVDPAIAGGVLLVAATDVLGFLIFLGLATLLLL